MANFKILHFTISLFIFSVLAQSDQTMKSRKLDESNPPADLQNKCGSCPCNNPCNPPVSPPPPPKQPPPPPPKQPPPSSYCQPSPPNGGGGGQYPPSPPYIFINGPPQDLYPVYSTYSGAGRSYSEGLVPISWAVGLIIAFW